MARELLAGAHFEVVLQRLAAQLVENHNQFDNTVLIGLQPRGIYLALRLQKLLQTQLQRALPTGRLDITFYRDDFRRRNEPILPSALDIEFSIENQHVILVDDVFFTGRTVRSGLEAMQAFGRPDKVELLVLVDRKHSRHLPIAADYAGIKVDTRLNERVKVEWAETDGADKVWLFNQEESKKQDS